LKESIEFLTKEEEKDLNYTFAIILARFQDAWLLVRHKDRLTWELPAGHVDDGELVEEAAVRELQEETGAVEFELVPLVSYRGRFKGREVYGKLFSAEISLLGPLPDFEIAEIKCFAQIPENLTYPEIQPVFIEWYSRFR